MKTYKRYAAAILAALMLAGCSQAGTPVNETDIHNGSQEVTLAKKQNETDEVKSLAKPVLPEILPYPDQTKITDWDKYEKANSEWRKSINALRAQPKDFEKSLLKMSASTAPVFLSDSGANTLYSPVSMYMALAMCAEVTDGDTRAQILDVLRTEDIEALRSQTKSVWQSCYNDDGLSKTVIANSLWLSDKLPVKRGAVDRLADSYYAYVYRGKIGTDGFDKAMQKFFSDGTDGLLDDSISGIKTKKTDAMVLASTLSFSGKWTSPFPKSGTEKAVFHGTSGDTKCDFLNGRRDMSYWSGDNFAYIELPFEENCYMRLILPDEGTSPADLINDSSFMGKMMGTKKNDTSCSGHISVTYSVPKFDVMSDTDLVEGMKELGIKDIFGSEADFSAVTTDKGISLSQAKQSVRVQIDEEGCKASAITAMIACGAAMPQDSAEIVFDRPFIFQIMTEKGLPLFIGIVNEP